MCFSAQHQFKGLHSWRPELSYLPHSTSLPLYEWGFTSAETCCSSDMQRGVMQIPLWQQTLPLWQQSLGTTWLSLVKCLCFPATGAGVWLLQQLYRAPGAAPLASVVMPVDATKKLRSAFNGSIRGPNTCSESLVLNTYCPAPQLKVATWLILCIHQAKLCKCTKHSAPVQAPALKSAAWAPPHLMCWKENRDFIFPSKASCESGAKFLVEDSSITEPFKYQKMQVAYRALGHSDRLSHNCLVNWDGELLSQQVHK